MASDLLGISISGLRYSQTALSTTGHNIANAGTEGYSRQRATAVTNPAHFQGNGYVGNGVSADAITRVVNDFVTQQLQTDSGLFAGLDTYNGQVGQLNNLLSDTSTGLTGALQSFFASVQNGANDPTSIPARELILSEAEGLADRFNSIHGRFQSMHNSVQGAMEVAVNQVNALTDTIAGLNQKIANANGSGASPNDLLDQRDEALRKLSEFVSIRTLAQDNGQINVSVGKGQSLVIGGQARTVGLDENPSDPTKLDIGIEGPPFQTFTDNIDGGQLHGLIKFRDGALNSAFNELGRIAVVLADEFNRVHQDGISLDNEFGGLFFGDINVAPATTNRSVSNRSGLEVAVTIENTARLEAAEYEAVFDSPTTYRLYRVPGGEEVTGSASEPDPLASVGLSLTPNVPFEAGDRLRLQPVQFGGQEISRALQRPEDIAMASPLTTVHASSNMGSGKVGETTLLNPAIDDADMPVVIEFTSDTTYQIYGASDPYTPVAAGLTFTAGSPLFSSTVGDSDYAGIQASITGNPAAGDRFTFDFNSDGGLDNRNGLRLADLQTQDAIGSNASFSQAYGALVEKVGIQTSSSRISRDAAEQVLSQTQALRESASGVNLDEEAANLIRFEQLFSANAQVISVARQLFDQLISSF